MDPSESRRQASQRLLEGNLERSITRLREHAERLQSRFDEGRYYLPTEEARRQVADAWAKHKRAQEQLQQMRTVYVVEPSQRARQAQERRTAPVRRPDERDQGR